MNKRFLLAVAFALIGLCLQTAMAQQSSAPARPTPQLTSDDLAPAPAPAPVEEAAPAPAITNSSRSWSRHSYSDLGVSIEFVGKPLAAMTYPGAFPENPLFDKNVKTLGLRSDKWALGVVRLTAFKKLTREELVNFVSIVAAGLGIASPQYTPERDGEPSFRISGTLDKSNGQGRIDLRLIHQDNLVWVAFIICSQTDAQARAEALHIVDSIAINR